MPELAFYNTLTRKKSAFTPLDKNHVRIYVCGPTVYDRIHIGNARPVVVFDVLVRLLRHHYPEVTYVRNITDVDDRINARALEMQIKREVLTQSTAEAFHEDCIALKSLAPNFEPLATEHIPQMIDMITKLIEKGHAYEAEGHVLFDVSSMKDYGKLSRHSQDELLAGARVEVAPYKKNPGDFVLWKPSDGTTKPGWESPWGYGRPGWHIECSAMSKAYLGEEFDIHAGGLDLIFPHHENEIAQSRCAHGSKMMAQFWMHNGYVTVDSEKMSKSLGNFSTVADVLVHYPGEAIRYALLAAHYRAPMDFSIAGIEGAKTALDGLYRAVENAADGGKLDQAVLNVLGDDLNTPKALALLHDLARQANKGDGEAGGRLKASAALLGLLQDKPDQWFKGDAGGDAAILNSIKAREEAKANKNFAEADRIRDELARSGIMLEDTPKGTIWRRK
jgi:cysteinyl-tRNA synthetase